MLTVEENPDFDYNSQESGDEDDIAEEGEPRFVNR